MKTRYFPSWTSLLLLAGSAAIINPAFAEFIISGESNCYGNGTYSYYFSETAIVPDYKVKISENSLLPDITVKIVSDPKQADLIFVDEFKRSNMKVCKSSSSIDAKRIKVSSTTLFPDVTVNISEKSPYPAYKIFILSETFTNEEVVALFAVIWKENRKKQFVLSPQQSR
jgi:hypothetical protein